MRNDTGHYGIVNTPQNYLTWKPAVGKENTLYINYYQHSQDELAIGDIVYIVNLVNKLVFVKKDIMDNYYIPPATKFPDWKNRKYRSLHNVILKKAGAIKYHNVFEEAKVLSRIDDDNLKVQLLGKSNKGTSTTIVNIPCEYMDCNALAFDEGDYALVVYDKCCTDRKVIGFTEGPQACYMYVLMKQVSCICSDIYSDTSGCYSHKDWVEPMCLNTWRDINDRFNIIKKIAGGTAQNIQIECEYLTKATNIDKIEIMWADAVYVGGWNPQYAPPLTADNYASEYISSWQVTGASGVITGGTWVANDGTIKRPTNIEINLNLSSLDLGLANKRVFYIKTTLTNNSVLFESIMRWCPNQSGTGAPIAADYVRSAHVIDESWSYLPYPYTANKFGELSTKTQMACWDGTFQKWMGWKQSEPVPRWSLYSAFGILAATGDKYFQKDNCVAHINSFCGGYYRTARKSKEDYWRMPVVASMNSISSDGHNNAGDCNACGTGATSVPLPLGCTGTFSLGITINDESTRTFVLQRNYTEDETSEWIAKGIEIPDSYFCTLSFNPNL